MKVEDPLKLVLVRSHYCDGTNTTRRRERQTVFYSLHDCIKTADFCRAMKQSTNHENKVYQ